MTIELPDEIADRAEQAGLLEPERLSQLFERELSVQKPLTFREIAARVAALNEPPMPMEEIVDEIKAYRRERRMRNESNS